jgi:hypothetical protein
MPGTHPAAQHGRDGRAAATSAQRPIARTTPVPEVPAWETFPVADRQRLVRTILQTARRQVEARPAPAPSLPTR